MSPQLRGIGLGIANRIDFFLQGKEDVCRRVQAGAPVIYPFSDTSPSMQGEGLRARLLALEAFQKIPGIGYVSLFQVFSYSVLLVVFSGSKRRRTWSMLAPRLCLTLVSLNARPT